MIPYWLSRTQLMLGDEKVENLMGKNVLIVGLGGVGGICAEMIVRAGVGKMTIVDNDIVDESNINRQIQALQSTVKQPKAQVLAARLKDINPELDLTVMEVYIKEKITIKPRKKSVSYRVLKYYLEKSFDKGHPLSTVES